LLNSLFAVKNFAILKAALGMVSVTTRPWMPAANIVFNARLEKTPWVA
jgi:hypothetical protein